MIKDKTLPFFVVVVFLAFSFVLSLLPLTYRERHGKASSPELSSTSG